MLPDLIHCPSLGRHVYNLPIPVCAECKQPCPFPVQDKVFDCLVKNAQVSYAECTKCDLHSELVAEGRESLEHWRDLFKGRRGFLLATGPSVLQQDISWLKDEIVLGVNFAHKITQPQGWVPNFMCCADAKVAVKLADEYRDLRSCIVISDTVVGALPEPIPNSVCQRGISIYYDDQDFNFDILGETHTPRGHSSTIHLALPFLCFLGCNPIYLLGCDCTAIGHAYDDKGAVGCPGAKGIYERHFFPACEMIKEKMKRKRRGIFNATQGGHLEVFPRVELGSLREE